MQPITVIYWTDCFAPCSGPWVEVDSEVNDTSERLVIVTVGYVFKETEHYVSICSSAGLPEIASGDFEGTAVSGIMHIPQRQIDKRVEFDVESALAKAPEFTYERQ